jgi:hypothetical protein
MTGLERLMVLEKELSAQLERLTTGKFCMRDWFSDRYTTLLENPFRDDISLETHLKEGFCNSIVCLFGFACLIPTLQKEGLQILIENGKSPRPAYKNLKDFYAAQEFFEIFDTQTIHLFSSFSYSKDQQKDPIEALNRLRTLIANKQS